MKQNIKFFAIVISLLLLSSVILTGCMYAIAADHGEMKSYNLNGQKENSNGSGGNIVEGDAPLSQSALQEKFNSYLHKDGNIVTIFSEEQYAELKAVRENGERIPLTYDEILFLVNDSIGIYFKYDEIRLNNAVVDGISHKLYLSSNAEVIYPYHGDYSEFEKNDEAYTQYKKMLEDIYSIIYYRIHVHDAGFETVHHTYHSGEEYVFGNRYAGDLGMIDSAVPQGRYQMLAIDNATFSGIDNEEKLVGEYKTLLEWKHMYKMDAVIDYDHYPYLNSAVLYTSILNIDQYSMEYRFYIVGPKDEPAQQIYPTAELEGMMPYQEFYYEVSASDDRMQPVFSLNYENGTVTLGASIYYSFSMVGTFEEHDGVLKMYFEDCSYVFYKHENGYVYSAENSKPVTSGGFDFADGLVFIKIKEGVSTKPNTDPPINNNGTNPPVDNNDSKNEVEIPYFKLDMVGGVCSSMVPSGNSYADGTYIQEGDAHILYFDNEFWYVFYYDEGVGYEYSKGESNAVPGYEFKDGTWFSLNDGILTVNND